MNKKIGIFDFLESLNPNTLGAVYSCNGLVLLTDKEYSFRLEQIRELQTKVNQLETNIEEAIRYINKIVFEDYAVMYDNGSTILEYEHDFKENLLEILERGKE